MPLLPLTAFEKYMILDNHPGYEMTILMEWAFKGKINKDLLIEAYKRVTKYEPLFRAVLSKKKGKLYWDVDDQHLIPLSFETTEESIEKSEGFRQVLSISPEKSCGHIIVREYCDGIGFDVHVHHAIGDGLGSHQFFANWMKEYDLLLHGQTDTSTLNFHPDPDLFTRREEFHFAPKEKTKLSSFFYDFYNGIAQFFCRRVLPLINEDKIDKKIAEITPLYWRKFGKDFFLKYKAKAKSFGVSVNTLMIRDMYITVRKWNEKHPFDDKPTERQRRWTRILVPMNIRTDFHRTIPCANILGYIFLDRRPIDSDRSPEFLQAIQKEMSKCLRLHSGAIFVSAIQFLEKIPGMMPFLTSDKQCHCSLILSTVGNACKSSEQEDYRQNDDIRIEHDQYPLQLFRMLGAPPTRPHSPISVGITQRQNEAFISFRYDNNIMSDETMLEFYDMFADEMMKSIE